MIPRANITAWRSRAPWPSDEQVEQDLVLCRALVDMFRCGLIADQAVFRGGTALHKLFLGGAQRYSEDFDLVQREAGPIGALIDAIREALDPWPGAPRFQLLIAGGAEYDPVAAAAVVQTELVARLSGEPWRGAGPE